MAKLIANSTTHITSALRAHGYSKEQTKGFQEALRDIDLNDEVATKSDLKDLELRMTKSLTGLNSRLTATIGLGVAFLALLMSFLKFFD